MEAAEQAVEVGVDEAQQLLPDDHGRHQAAALVDLFGTCLEFRAVAQAERAGAASFIKPGGDGVQQIGGRFALGHLRAGDGGACAAVGRGFQHQQHAPCAQQLGHFFDDELQQRGRGLGLVQAQAGVDQALHAFLQAHGAMQVGGEALWRQRSGARCRHPGAQQVSVLAQALLQVAAAQAFVAERAHALHQQGVGGGQRLKGRLRPAVGKQRTVMRPPESCVGHRAAPETALALLLQLR